MRPKLYKKIVKKQRPDAVSDHLTDYNYEQSDRKDRRDRRIEGIGQVNPNSTSIVVSYSGVSKLIVFDIICCLEKSFCQHSDPPLMV